MESGTKSLRLGVALFEIEGRVIGKNYPPFVIAEVGINHNGDMRKAIRMIDDAYKAGCECVKFQTHIVSAEMIPNTVIPGNATESIWDIITKASLLVEQEHHLKEYVEDKGMIFLSTPFSKEAADRLEELGVSAYKIGSGECNNYPLVQHIASFGKPVVLSTGMNNVQTIYPAVEILRKAGVPFALLQCTSIYPTPYTKVNLGAIGDLQRAFPDAVIGLSDHSLGNYTSYAAVALGAGIIEKHFTSDKSWAGPDNIISIDPKELEDLVYGTKAVYEAMGGEKQILPEEQPTIDFAYSCVVTTRAIREGERLSRENIWVKRPGTGEIKAKEYSCVLGMKPTKDLPNDYQIKWCELEP